MEIIEIALRIVEKMPFGALCFLNGGYKVAMWHPKRARYLSSAGAEATHPMRWV
jgi:hypothetical protein